MWLQAFNNRNAQKCAIAHLIRHSMHIVEPWRLFLLSSATLWRSRSIHGVKSTGAHGMRTCRPFASSAFGCECLLSPPASRCPRPG